MIEVVLPWPAAALNPNSRAHWGKKSNATKGAWLAAHMVTPSITMHGPIKCHVVACPPDRRRRDLDNVLASMKAYFDGISSRIGVDDSEWSFSIERGKVDQAGGSVIVRLHPAAVEVPFCGAIS